MAKDNIKQFSMTKGDTFAFQIEILDFDTHEVYTGDLTSAYFSVKKRLDSKNFTFQKSIGDGITKVKDGYYRVRVAPEDTADIISGLYVYDLQITIGDDVKTILKGTLNIEQDVT